MRVCVAAYARPCNLKPSSKTAHCFYLKQPKGNSEMQIQTTLLHTKDAAKFLNVSIAFLERDRWAGARVPFVKVGSRAVRYRIEDLENYINSQRHQSILEVTK